MPKLAFMPKTYRDLKAWQRSIDLAEKIYHLTEDFPQAEIYGLTSQMRRAAVSIASNLAEGWGRRSRREFGRFVLVAHGSNDELKRQLLIAERLGFGEYARLAEAVDLCDEVGRLLNGLRGYLNRPRMTA